jgi:hypothetical protein
VNVELAVNSGLLSFFRFFDDWCLPRASVSACGGRGGPEVLFLKYLVGFGDLFLREECCHLSSCCSDLWPLYDLYEPEFFCELVEIVVIFCGVSDHV